MSWHTSLIAIKAPSLPSDEALLELLGFPGLVAQDEVTGDGAGSSSLPGKAVGRVQRWTMLWDPTMFLGDDSQGMFEDSIWSKRVDAALRRLSLLGEAYSFLAEGASGTFGFALYRAGDRARLRLVQEDEVVMDAGDPIREESPAAARAEGDEEELLFQLLQEVTGITLDQVFAERFRVYA